MDEDLCGADPNATHPHAYGSPQADTTSHSAHHISHTVMETCDESSHGQSCHSSHPLHRYRSRTSFGRQLSNTEISRRRRDSLSALNYQNLSSSGSIINVVSGGGGGGETSNLVRFRSSLMGQSAPSLSPSMNVENCFGISGVPLAIQGRVLVGEGILTKGCRKKLKPRQVFLFNDILVYGSIIINKKKYNRQHIIPLENVKLDDLDDEDNLRYGWQIKTPTKSFNVYAATATEKVEWMAHINKCVDELIKAGNRPASEHAAVWKPDNTSNICMHCKKTQFTVINRRHHCRSCGDVVCGHCSKSKFLIPNQSAKPVRVCDGCYDKLGKLRISSKDNSYNNVDSSVGKTDTKTEHINESSDSEDDETRQKQTDDDLTRSLEDLTIDEKPTFYSSVKADV
ncbi:unnamed protein product [Oppiella nova]|uniref:Pleckstrin homology domain-containing family F member 2 n=1 Tax=Oppiella nova TaxID=334625 RepID=A0A7R9MD33_9ACAR|nr:unnamed protein product [Oppiella nova]CAG2174960.1 unnamed protein product [Oppiella nova]